MTLANCKAVESQNGGWWKVLFNNSKMCECCHWYNWRHRLTLWTISQSTLPPSFLTDQLPRLTTWIATDDNDIILPLQPGVFRWNNIRTANSYKIFTACYITNTMFVMVSIISIFLEQYFKVKSREPAYSRALRHRGCP